MKKTIEQNIHEVIDDWKYGNETDRGFYNMYVGLIIDESPIEQQRGLYSYWKSLKKNSKLERELK